MTGLPAGARLGLAVVASLSLGCASGGGGRDAMDTDLGVDTGYFVDVFADFVVALDALPEAGGTLLDNCCILGTTDVAGGWDHDFNDFPQLIAGGAGGALPTPGVHVNLAGDNACRAGLTCLRAVGVPIDSWGTDQFLTDAPIPELEV